MGCWPFCCGGLPNLPVFVRLLTLVDSDSSDHGLYEPLLEDREREAVSDLLSFLENVRQYSEFQLRCPNARLANQRRLLYRRPLKSPHDPSLLR